MIEKLLTSAVKSHDTTDRERLIQQMIHFPEDVFRLLRKQFVVLDEMRQAILMKVLRQMSLQKKVEALPHLIEIIQKPDHPGWSEAVNILIEVGPNLVVPYFINTLLTYSNHNQENKQEAPLRGICCMLRLKKVDSEYARRCAPTINYLLIRLENINDPESGPELHFLLDVIEKARIDLTYIIPNLIVLAQLYRGNHIGARARQLIEQYQREDKNDYSFYLN
ncbi:hypothetical protein [Tengunoibacter tsumagoiensis]|uniref:Uncharacterized protein n=1 Tax=Tengunoibacter tsumagoiensis TaxID=2014871 RepID=A0A402A5N2_9CHLR|nr:hypothetical protein [Tengunoibacter tsumagoiensis]GCE14438.1 hypothetical protein KTT_42970 [Tengunoibacter tsumagoiensis]